MQQRNKTEKPKLLSVIIPSYNQEKTISRSIKSIERTLKSLGLKYEIIIVDDGSTDKTAFRAEQLKSRTVKVYSYRKNQGKGNAVKVGVIKAKGDVIGFIDGGMDLQAKGITVMLNSLINNRADIVVGSKLHPESVVYYPWQRQILSFGYRTITRILFNLKVKDTQVGLKLFRRKVAKDVFPRNLVKEFAFDVETLALAHQLGYTKIYEAPITLVFKGDMSSITNANFWKVSIRMLIDTLGIFYRLRIKKSYRK